MRYIFQQLYRIIMLSKASNNHEFPKVSNHLGLKLINNKIIKAKCSFPKSKTLYMLHIGNHLRLHCPMINKE